MLLFVQASWLYLELIGQKIGFRIKSKAQERNVTNFNLFVLYFMGYETYTFFLVYADQTTLNRAILFMNLSLSSTIMRKLYWKKYIIHTLDVGLDQGMNQ